MKIERMEIASRSCAAEAPFARKDQCNIVELLSLDTAQIRAEQLLSDKKEQEWERYLRAAAPCSGSGYNFWVSIPMDSSAHCTRQPS